MMAQLETLALIKCFQLFIEECAPLDDKWADTHCNARPLFMVAASCENCAASVIYYFLRRNLARFVRKLQRRG